MNWLGLNAGSHDTGAALVADGALVCAVEEERLNRQKHTKVFPWNSLQGCLDTAGIGIQDLDGIAFGWDFPRFLRDLYLRPLMDDLSGLPFLARDLPKLQEFLAFPELIRERTGYRGPILHYGHHDCHLAYTHQTSGYEEANLLSLDGYGDDGTTVLASGGPAGIRVHQRYAFPNSLGLAYSALTWWLGFKHHCDEGIVMGLASYGRPQASIPGGSGTYLEAFREIIRHEPGEPYAISGDWLAVGHVRNTWVTPRFLAAFGPPRVPDSELTQHHMDMSAGLQARLEEVALDLAWQLHALHPCDRLCVTGGVALNCVMNAALLERGPYKEVYAPPSPGDAGIPAGAALMAFLDHEPGRRLRPQSLIGLGPMYPEEALLEALGEAGLKVDRRENLVADVADLLAQGCMVGWYEGRSEFGPRALGHRSILCRPYPAEMKDILNAKVKFREWFRPFAPIVLKEKADEYFHALSDTPYMMHAFKVRPEAAARIPATVHVDGTCRVQTVDRQELPRLAALLEAFETRTGVGVILNTSFNIKGQPIVETPADAVASFLGTRLDALVLGDYLVLKDAWE